jgi:hypothetical protein
MNDAGSRKSFQMTNSVMAADPNALLAVSTRLPAPGHIEQGDRAVRRAWTDEVQRVNILSTDSDSLSWA